MQLPARRRIADRIWQWRKTAYAVSVLVVLAVLVLVFLSISTPSAAVEIPTDLTFFDSQRAFQRAQSLARLYPDRQLGSQEALGATAWYEDVLSSQGIEFARFQYTMPHGMQDVTVTNIAVILAGADPETIVISSPRDALEDAQVSPLAQASGTATLLDLARVFAERAHDKTLVFLSTEGGVQGSLGAAAFLANYERRADVQALVSIQALGMEGRDTLYAGTIGPGSSTPGWMVELATNILGQINVDLRVPNLQQQIASQALQVLHGEQVAGLSRGIASLTIYDRGEGAVTAAGLSSQGAAVERLILALDQAGAFPRDPGTAVVLGSGRFITKTTLNILGLIFLVPPLLMAAAWLLVTRLKPAGWLRHLRNLASFLLPLGLMPLLGCLTARIGLLPIYARHAVPVSGSAVQPQWPITLVLLSLFLLAFVLLRHFLGYLRPQEPRAVTEMAKLTGGLVLLEIGLALLVSSSPFSLLGAISAAWLWPFCTCFLEPPSAAVPWWPQLRTNAHILLAGLLASLAVYAYLVVTTGIGWLRGWWFLLVQMVSGTYGIAAPAGVVFIASAFIVLLGSRRMQIIPVETLVDADGDVSVVMAPPPRVLKVEKKEPSST